MIRKHIPSLRLILLQAVLLGVLLLVVLPTVSSSPSVCGSCHAMKPYVAAQRSGSHSSIGCYACHLPAGLWSMTAEKSAEFLGMYPAALMGRGVSGPSALVDAGRCMTCHSAVYTGATFANGIRIKHSSCAEGVSCDECHADIPHGSAIRWTQVADMAQCVACHRDQNAPRRCDTCHAGRPSASRLAAGPWAVTHGAQWKITHGMGDLRYCDACHPSNYCVQCHATPLPHPATFYGTHGTQATLPKAKCLSCHTAKFCSDCHGMQMPHPANFLIRHSVVASSSSDPKCLACHIQDDCVRCHVAHAHPGRTNGTLGGTTLPQAKIGVR